VKYRAPAEDLSIHNRDVFTPVAYISKPCHPISPPIHVLIRSDQIFLTFSSESDRLILSFRDLWLEPERSHVKLRLDQLCS
jgi:hypothetical protein